MERQLRVMVVGAHPDDCDFSYGGIALKNAAAGHKVKFLSLCNGCYGHHVMTPKETAARRYLETQKAAKIAGIAYSVWDVDDCTIEATMENRKRRIRKIPFAEAFGLSEYGTQLTEETTKELFPF